MSHFVKCCPRYGQMLWVRIYKQNLQCAVKAVFIFSKLNKYDSESIYSQLLLGLTKILEFETLFPGLH